MFVRTRRITSYNLRYTPFAHTHTPRCVRQGQVVGDYGGEGTPGPFSNPVVKLTRADGTWGVTPWESKSSPTHTCPFPFFGPIPIHEKHPLEHTQEGVCDSTHHRLPRGAYCTVASSGPITTGSSRPA